MENNDQTFAMREFDLAWKEYFKDKPEPKSDKEEKKQLENFYHWYNYVRKQSDTKKTPAEMYKEAYGEEPPKDFPINADKSSRIMNFEWDEDYDEDFDLNDGERLDQIKEVADHMFENGVWSNSKVDMKEMSKRESSKHMFRLGAFLYHKYITQQMRDLANEMKDMSREEIKEMIDDFKDNEND